MEYVSLSRVFTDWSTASIPALESTSPLLARSCASSHMRPVAWQPAVQLESAATRYQPDEGGGGVDGGGGECGGG